MIFHSKALSEGLGEGSKLSWLDLADSGICPFTPLQKVLPEVGDPTMKSKK